MFFRLFSDVLDTPTVSTTVSTGGKTFIPVLQASTPLSLYGGDTFTCLC